MNAEVRGVGPVMRLRTLSLVAGLSVIVILAPGTSNAAKTKLKYADAKSDSVCRAAAGSSCAGLPLALRTGRISAETSITSPEEGLLPGGGYTAGVANIVATYVLKRAVALVPLSATVRIDAGSLRHTGLLKASGANQTAPPQAGLGLYLEAFDCGTMTVKRCIASQSWLESGAFVWQRLLDLQQGPVSMSARTITLKTVLRPTEADEFGP